MAFRPDLPVSPPEPNNQPVFAYWWRPALSDSIFVKRYSAEEIARDQSKVTKHKAKNSTENIKAKLAEETVFCSCLDGNKSLVQMLPIV